MPAGRTIEVELEDEREADQGTPIGGGEDEGGGNSILRDWRLWVGVGAGVVAIALGVGLGVGLGNRDPEFEDPVQGNMSPGVLTWP